MPLQFVVDSLDSIPAELRGNYKEADGKFRLDVDGYEDPVSLKSALQKEREAAKAAAREVGAWKSLGKTPEEIQAALAHQQELEEKALISEKKFDELHAKRTERLQAEHAKTVKAEQEARLRAETKAAKLAAGKVSGVLTQAAAKGGALPDAHDDIVLRAERQGWTINDDGDVVAMRDGEVVLGKDGKTPLAPMEFIESLRETAPHLFQRAQGSNAPGSGSGARGTSNKGKLDGTPEERSAYFAAKYPALKT